MAQHGLLARCLAFLGDVLRADWYDCGKTTERRGIATLRTPHFCALVASILLPVPVSADVAAVAQTFVNVCPAALIQGTSPLDLGMEPQVEGISRVLTREVVATMPGVFWRNDATQVTMSLPLGGLICVLGGEVGEPLSALEAFDEWRARHTNVLQLNQTKTLGQTAAGAGVFLELCLMDPSDHKEHRVIGEINKRAESWSLNLTLHRDVACEASN